VPYLVSAKFGNLRVQADFSEQGRDLSAQPASGSFFSFGGIAQDISHFLFHAPPMQPCTSLQARLDLSLNIPNNQLSHQASLLLSRYRER
jgi:hypothetical protein